MDLHPRTGSEHGPLCCSKLCFLTWHRIELKEMKSQERHHMDEGKEKTKPDKFYLYTTFKKSEEKHVDTPESTENRNRQINEDRQRAALMTSTYRELLTGKVEKASSRVQRNSHVAPSREVHRLRTAWFQSHRSNVYRRRWERSWYRRNSFSMFRHGSRTQKKRQGTVLLTTFIQNVLQSSNPC